MRLFVIRKLSHYGILYHLNKGVGMSLDKICKTVHQYNKEPIADGDMQKLLDIAEDYRKVKNLFHEAGFNICKAGSMSGGTSFISADKLISRNPV